MSIPSCTIFAREWTAKVCLRLCMQAPPERLLEQGILHFSNTFLKPPKTVQEDNGRPDGDINKNLSGASTSGKGILLRYSKYCCRTLDRESLKGISLSILFFVFRIMMQFLLKSTSRFLMDMASPILIPVAYKILYKAGNAKRLQYIMTMHPLLVASFKDVLHLSTGKHIRSKIRIFLLW